MSDASCSDAQKAKSLALEATRLVEETKHESRGGKRLQLREEAQKAYELKVRHKIDTGWVYENHTSNPYWEHTERIMA